MPQRDRYTRNLDFRKRATITGRRIRTVQTNYSVVSNEYGGDSGTMMVADNSSQNIFFSLPPVNAINGQFYEFFNANTGKMQIVGDTNAIVCTYGVTIKAVNYGIVGALTGVSGAIWGDGTKYLLMSRPGSQPTSNTYLNG